MQHPRPPLWLAVLGAALAFATPASASIDDCDGTITPSNPTNRVVELRFPFLAGAESVCIELLDDQAPLTTANFINYLQSGDFDDSLIHRTVTGFVVQGGGFRVGIASGKLERIPTDPAVTNEPCTLDTPSPTPEMPNRMICSQRGNVRGTLAMAKTGGNPNSATNQWFVNLADNRGNLDNQNGGFTVFARVLGSGMAVIDQIAAFPHLPNALYTLDASPRTLLSAFGVVPVQAQPMEPPGGFGCFDPNELAVPFSSTGVSASDVPTGTPLARSSEPSGLLVVSGACGLELASASQYVGTPTMTATCGTGDTYFAWGVADQSGELVYRNQDGPVVVAADFPPVPYHLTCAQLEQSDAALAGRRGTMMATTDPLLVRIESARVVPEPEVALLGATSLATLAALSQRRRRCS